MPSLRRRARTAFQRFAEAEASGGLMLMASAALGLIVANSPFAAGYNAFLHAKVAGLDVLHWVNDGLMALFFLLVGLEIKRELRIGELDSWPRRTLPLAAAIGGMVVPVLILLAINWRHPENWRGWAIPTATDIAFALGVLALLGSRVPHGLKVFLTSVAIVDDLGAIVIIALFYASGLFVPALAAAALLAAALFGLNTAGVVRLAPYLLLGIALWTAMLFSGIHATLAGVVVAMAIPIGSSNDNETSASPLCRLEDRLGVWVAFLVLPVFGFANAGVSLQGLSTSLLFTPLSLGIAVGLFVGKQVGIMMAVFAMRWTGLAGLPQGVSWRAAYGMAILCGIGFTMSLFIGLLAFPDPEREVATKVAVLVGSLLSALAGVAVLLGLPRAEERE